MGQELLTAGHHGASVVVLEAALKIGTCSLKLRGSVFSALSSAYWSLGNTEKSTGYMQQDLDVAKTLGRVTLPSFVSVQGGAQGSRITGVNGDVLEDRGLQGFPSAPKGQEMWINIFIALLRELGSQM